MLYKWTCALWVGEWVLWLIMTLSDHRPFHQNFKTHILRCDFLWVTAIPSSSLGVIREWDSNTVNCNFWLPSSPLNTIRV